MLYFFSTKSKGNNVSIMFDNKKTTIHGKLIIAAAMIAVSILIIFVGEKLSIFDGLPWNEAKNSNTPIVREGFFFDTYVSVMIYDSKDNYSDEIASQNDIENLLATCMSMCSEYENVFSRTLETSELYKLNHNPDFINGADLYVSDTLSECITKTLEYSGVFGIKYSIMSGTLCDLWDYNNETIPENDDIVSNCIAIDAYKLTVINNRIKLTFNVENFKQSAEKYGYVNLANDTGTNILMPNVEINLGSSAKGYIADKICEYLKDNGINDAIIDLGGNIVVIGDKYDGSMYKIGIKKPFSEENESYAVCKVADKAVVTSGIYERYFEKNGTIYHHIIDCSTGYPVSNDILSVTIITDDSLLADCYSTGCLLIGKDNALTLINDTEGVECVIIDKSYNIHLSNGLTYDNEMIVLK